MYQILQEASGHWPLVALTSLVLYFMTVATYRLTLHPLAKFPGPKLAAITKWYEAYYDLVAAPGGQFSGQIRNMHDKYGPIVRINPTEVSVRDPEFYETLYAPQPAVRDKFPPIAAVLGTTSGTFGTIDHHVHRKRRAANSNFFSSRNLALSEPLIQAHVERFCKHLRDGAEAGTVFRLRTWFMALKLDIFFEYAFADTLGLLDNTELAGYWDDTMEAISYCAPFVKMFPDLIQFSTKIPWIFVRMVSPELARVLALHKRIRVQASKFAADPERFSSEQKSQPDTLFQTLHESNLPPKDKKVWRVSQEGAEMFAAAGTTARVMSAAIFHLHNRPETLQLLRQEIDAAFPDPQVIPPVKVLENLPYMAVVIRESLRMAAPVATRLPLVPRQPIFYKQWAIPAKTPVSVNGRDMLHDPDIFPDPLVFKPERWQSEGKGAEGVPEKYFVPFGKGTRMCQGRDFAMYELLISIAVLIRRFEFELVDTIWERDVRVVRDCFLSEPMPGSQGVKVRIVKERA